jgi:glycosyltransferase involved in cell wall biosynthesis
VPVVSISDSQRRPLPQANFVDTVLHGLPERLLTPQGNPQGYLAFLGRIAPEKCPDRAINIAQACGIPIKLAAKIDVADKVYFDKHVRHLLDQPGVDMIGEIGDRDKPAFLSGAIGLLMPIDWPEPFGLVMIEAMACGTPVIAFNRGSVPEIIEDGVTGFIVEDVAGAIAAVQKIHTLDRARVRRRFEERFTARRMAEDYIDVYRSLAGEDRSVLRAIR